MLIILKQGFRMILFYMVLYSLAYIAIGLAGLSIYFVMDAGFWISFLGMVLLWAVVSASILFALSRKRYIKD